MDSEHHGLSPKRPEDHRVEGWLKEAFGRPPTAGSEESVLKALRAAGALPGPDHETGVPAGADLGGDPPPPEVPASGERVGRYEVTGEVGRGGMGVVVRGHDADLGRDVALKLLRRRHEHDPAVLQRFVEEAQIGGQLQHPGIVPVYEIGLLGGQRPYFTMKLVQGETLAAILGRRPSPADMRHRLLLIFRQVCETVAYAHARGVIHRDLKPANVMVGSFGEVQVVDWGLAKVLQRGARVEASPTSAPERSLENVKTARAETPEFHSTDGAVFGTYAYMAPEQARGEVQLVDERADVFALGAILCEILTGSPPYAGESALAVSGQATAADLSGAFERLKRCPEEDAALVAIARRGLAHDPAQRPRSAEVLAEEIGSYLASVDERARQAELQAAAGRARAAEADARARHERRARRLAVALAALFVVAVSGGTAGWWWVESARRQRAAATERGVEAALTEAAGHAAVARAATAPDVQAWGLAVAAARRAHDIALAGEAEPAVSATAAARVQEYEGEAARNARAVADRERNRRLADRLEELRSRSGFYLDFAPRSADFVRVFRDAGLDFETISAEEAVKIVRSSPMRENLIAGVDHWLYLLANWDGANRVVRQRLLQVSVEADADPLRVSIKMASREENAGEVVRLGASLDVMAASEAAVCLAAQQMMSLRAFPEAATLLRRAFEVHPGSFWINLTLGWASGLAEPPELEMALRHLTAALALRPDLPEIWFDIGCAHLVGKDYEPARECYRNLLSQRPDHAQGWNNLGLILTVHDKDYAGAIAAFQRVIALDGADTKLFMNLGDAHRGLRQHAAAAAAFRKAIDKGYEPRAEAWTSLGWELLWDGQLEEARQAFDHALEIEPSRAGALEGRGTVRHRLGDDDAALADLRRVLSIVPGAEGASAELCLLLLQREEWAEVVEVAERVIASPQASPAGLVSAWHNLGVARHRLGDPAAAVQAFERSLASGPPNAETHDAMAWSLLALGDAEGAIAALRRCLDLAPQHELAHGRLVDVLRRAGDLEALTAEFVRWAAAAPENAAVQAQAAGELLRMARAEPESDAAKAAVSVARRAVEVQKGNDPSTWHLLARALRAAGDLPGAAAAASKGLALPATGEEGARRREELEKLLTELRSATGTDRQDR